jgi:phage terminase large subunit GpA-like protein
MNLPELSKALAAALRPPERYTPGEWAERRFVLPAGSNAEPGRFRFARTPYLRGIVDAVVEPGVEDIIFVKPTRVGGTTAGQILLGYWCDNDPGPCLTVMPSEAACEQEIKERVRPMLQSCQSLREHVSPNPHDNTLSTIKLDTMTLYFGWAGSPQSLASNTCRYARFDEVDKYPPFAGREADPISLGKERTATYLHRKRHYITSTPTTTDGAIWRMFETCGDKRHFQVPCPHCGKYQRLTWPRVKWPKLDIPDKIKFGDEIERSRLAWYECLHCNGRIEESHKPKMLERGAWAGEGQTVDEAGVIQGERPTSKRVGFHLSSLYSPWRTFWEMAAEFIRAAGDIGATMNFYNSRLAEPFQVQVSRREPHAIREKAAAAATVGPAGAERVMPAWAVILIATADVQKDHCYWQVDAWGYEMKSKRVAIGIAATLDEAYRHVFTPAVPFVSESAGGQVYVSELIVDSGYRKDEVTEFARRDPQRIRMAKGLSTYFGPIAERKVEKASGVIVWNINTMQSKDTLDRLIGDPDPSRWQVFSGISDDFCVQLTSEHKVLDPKTKLEIWKEKTSGAANHWWDCSAMSCAVAAALGAAMVKPPDVVQSAPATNPLEHKRRW